MRRFSSMVLALLSVAAGQASVDPGLLSLAPADTQSVFSVNAQDARGSSLGQYLLKDPRWTDPKLQEFVNATGFDPRRDLLSFIVVSSTPGDPGNPGSSKSAVIARGNFDPSKIGAAAVKRGAQVQTINSIKVYLPTENQDRTRGFAFLDVDVAIMGDLDTLRQIIANRQSPSHLDPDLARLVDIASADHELWFASSGFAGRFGPHAMPAPDNQQAQQFARVLQGITQSSGGVKLGSDVQFSFNAVARSDKDANSLADVIRFVASAAQVKRDQDPQIKFLAPALDNLNLSTSGNEVHLTTSVPESLLEQVAASSGRQTAPAAKN